MKIIISLFFLSNLLFSAYYLDKKNVCIDAFFIKDYEFYYKESATSQWYNTTETNMVSTILSNFVYDADSVSPCSPNLSYMLGIDIKDFNFLLALVGVIFGGVFMFFTLKIFYDVGGKK